jgi:hypothetical protein
VKCSVARCCRQYHWDCLVANPLSRVNDSGRGAKCPLHYCAQCGLSGDGVPMVQCMLCDRGWHVRCRPQDVRLVSKRFVVCPRHNRQQHVGGAAATATAQLPVSTQQQQQQQQQPQCSGLPGGKAGQLQSRKRPHSSQPAAAAGTAADELCTTAPPVRQQQQQQQQQPGEDDAEEGELPSEGAEQLAACGQQLQQPPSPGSKRPRLAVACSTGVVAAGPSQALRSPSSRSILPTAVVSPKCQPSPLLTKQQQQQQPPGPCLCAATTAAPPDLDAAMSPTPLSPRLSLQPSWQASAAARASLDYGDL